MATRSLEGTPWSLADLRGKVVLDVFRKFGHRDDFVMVGVSLDARAETPVRSRERYDRPWLQLHEPDAGWENSLARALPVRGVPSICLIDRDGTLLELRLRGFNILQAVERALGT